MEQNKKYQNNNMTRMTDAIVNVNISHMAHHKNILIDHMFEHLIYYYYWNRNISLTRTNIIYNL